MNEKFLNEENQEASLNINIIQIIYLLFEKKWKIAICSILGAIIFAIVSITCITPKYRTSLTFYVSSDEATGSASSTYNDVMLSQLMVTTYMQFFVSNRVISEIAAESGLGYTPAEIARMISISQVNDTEIISFSITNPNPEHAYLIAKTFEDYAGEAVSAIDDKREIKVIDGVSEIPTVPYSPNAKKNTVLGFLIGFILSCAFYIFINLIDDKIKSTEDIKNVVNVPVIGIIPNFE